MDDEYLNDDAEELARALGSYIMLTATTEMRFLDLLQLVLLDDSGAHRAIWLQFQSTRSRLDMVRHTYRNTYGTTEPETVELSKLVVRFKRLTQQRNFYCHATYSVNPAEHSLTATGFKITETDEGISLKPKKIDTAAINEVRHLFDLMSDLSEDVEAFALRMQESLIVDGRLTKRLLQP